MAVGGGDESDYDNAGKVELVGLGDWQNFPDRGRRKPEGGSRCLAWTMENDEALHGSENLGGREWFGLQGKGEKWQVQTSTC